ncbi:MAG: oxidoreductase, partial [Candidatus Pelagibacter sp. TMED203]
NEQSRIDILINNAGNNIPEHFTKVKTKNMENLVKINTIAAFNVAQLCALKMIELKNRKKIGASIINISSQMGHVGGPIRSVYNMNKFGLEGLTKGMAIDLAKYNIRVNSIAPTFVITPLTRKFLKNKKFRKETLNNIPLGRFAEMSEVSSAVAFLASDAASMITGTSLLVDGGWTAK